MKSGKFPKQSVKIVTFQKIVTYNKGKEMKINLTNKKLTDERIKTATDKAQDAFWTSVAKSFPEIKSGDFPPLQTALLDRILYDAVEYWRYINEEKSND